MTAIAPSSSPSLAEALCITTAGRTDAPAIAALRAAAITERYRFATPPELRSAFAELATPRAVAGALGSTRQVIYCAWLNDALVATAAIQLGFEQPGHAHLCGLYVDPPATRSGIGTALMRHLTEVARAAGTKVLWTGTFSADVAVVRFFGRHGFTCVEERPAVNFSATSWQRLVCEVPEPFVLTYPRALPRSSRVVPEPPARRPPAGPARHPMAMPPALRGTLPRWPEDVTQAVPAYDPDATLVVPVVGYDEPTVAIPAVNYEEPTISLPLVGPTTAPRPFVDPADEPTAEVPAVRTEPLCASAVATPLAAPRRQR